VAALVSHLQTVIPEFVAKCGAPNPEETKKPVRPIIHELPPPVPSIPLLMKRDFRVNTNGKGRKACKIGMCQGRKEGRKEGEKEGRERKKGRKGRKEGRKE
jgi:hypothetical protein